MFVIIQAWDNLCDDKENLDKSIPEKLGICMSHAVSWLVQTEMKTMHPVLLERFRDFHIKDRITYRQSMKLIRNLEFRASSAQLYVYVWRTPWKRKIAA